MMWIFGLFIIAVIGGIAVVAAGSGGALPDVYDDRPDAIVPADGALTRDDLKAVRFSTVFRGYRASEVDALLDRLAAQLDDPAPAPRPPVDDAPRTQDDGGTPA